MWQASLPKALKFDALEKETFMRKLLPTSLAMSLGFATLAAAQPVDDSVKGMNVTLSGCVATDKEDSFILTHVSEVSGPKTPVSTPTTLTIGAMSGVTGGGNETVYWLSSDSVKLMRGHVGHKVQVTGVITEVTMGTLRIKQDPGKPGANNDNKVEVEKGDKKAGGETEAPVKPGPTPLVKTDEKQSLPVRRVKVDSFKVLAPTCP
jgi:hypothetical protein